MYIATQLYSCPYCSGEVIWDYSAGVVVCSSCGSVVDTIYDLYRYLDSNVEPSNPKRSRFSYIPKSVVEIERARKWVEVAERKAVSLKVVKALPKGVRKVCEYGIELAYKVSPSLIEGKSLRSRYAVGYMLYMLLMGKPIDAEKISRIFRISISTARRLMKNVSSKLSSNTVR